MDNDRFFVKRGKVPKAPCYQCPDRNEDCHSKCKIYIDWSTARAEERDRIHEIKQKRLDSANYIREVTNRYSKRK